MNLNAKQWLIHGATGLLSLLTAVSSAPPVIVALLGPHAMGIVGIAGAAYTLISLVWHAVSPSTAPTQGSNTGSGTVAKFLLLAPLLSLFMGLSACATLTSNQAQPYIQAAVDIAVATAEQKGVKATQINSIAKAALAADTGPTASLQAISVLINGKLSALNLPPGDVAAAQILEVALSAAIVAKISNNANVAQAQAAIADVLNYVVAATGG